MNNTREKPGSSGKKNEGKTLSKEGGDKHKEDKEESVADKNGLHSVTAQGKFKMSLLLVIE